MRSFVDAYRAKYGEDPDVYAAHGYDALKILVQAINTAQSAHPDDIRLALNGIHEYAGASGLTTFDKNGDVIRHPKIMIIRQGHPVAYDDYVKYKGEQGAKEAGKMRVEGKAYVVNDGDVMHFLFNV